MAHRCKNKRDRKNRWRQKVTLKNVKGDKPYWRSQETTDTSKEGRFSLVSTPCTSYAVRVTATNVAGSTSREYTIGRVIKGSFYDSAIGMEAPVEDYIRRNRGEEH